MDKNTIYGLLLMGLVFFGFMWLTPKKENPSPEKSTTEQTERPAATFDALTAQETEWLRNNISENGTRTVGADSVAVTTLNENGLNLTLRGDSVSGTVQTDGKTYQWADVVACDPSRISPSEQAKVIAYVRSMSNNMGRYGKFARFLSGTDSLCTLSNDVISLSLASRSGSIVKAELKDYETEYHADETVNQRRKVVLFQNGSDRMSFDIPLAQSISTADLYFRPVKVNDSTLRMQLDVAPDTYWSIEYILPRGESYLVSVRIVQKGMAKAFQSNNRVLGFHWNQKVARQEKGRMFEERNSGLFYKFAGGDVENLNEAKDDSEERKAKIRWIGFKNQFFSSVMIADRAFSFADFDSKVLKNSDYLKDLTADAQLNDYDWNAEVPASFHLYLGPNLYPLLSSMEDKIVADEDLELTRLIPLGWSLFRWINTLVVIPIFDVLGSFISDYGIIILLLTIFIKLVLFPLTYKSYKSQAKMRILAPDIKEINEKYPGQENAMIRQQKTMALYSKAGASPFSGCLPMLLQMPILFAMFSFFPSAIELRGQSFLWAHDLSAPDAIISWSGNIPLVTEYFGNHISLFCLLMTVTNIIYTHVNMQSNAGGGMPGMKWMMYLMPVFFLVFFNNYAAGLSYYYFLSLLITIIQTYAFRYIIKEEDVRKTMAENAKKPKKKSGFMARLEEMQKQQQAMMREQQKQGNTPGSSRFTRRRK